MDLEQEKERLNQEQRRLEELKRASMNEERNYMNTESNENNSEFVDHSFESNNLENLRLDTPKAINKKKYIILGFGLVLLFIITVLIIRLISNSDTQNKFEDVNVVKSEVSQEGILNKIDSNEEYQQEIDKTNTSDESKIITEKQKKELNEIVIPKQESNNVPLVLDTPQVKVEQSVKKVIKTEKQVLTTPKRKIVVAPPKEIDFTKKTDVIKGYFIQIGAFTQEPNRNLLKSIGTKGYTYKVHQVKINGKIYNKVLIGSFKTRAEATKKLGQVKLDFKNPSAYILEF